MYFSLHVNHKYRLFSNLVRPRENAHQNVYATYPLYIFHFTKMLPRSESSKRRALERVKNEHRFIVLVILGCVNETMDGGIVVSFVIWY